MRKITTLFLLALGIFSVSSLTIKAQLIMEGFETGIIPTTGWTLDNPNGLTTWSSAPVGRSGFNSVFYDAFNQPEIEGGETDALITNTVNLSSISNPSLTFYYAYQMFTDPSTYISSDELNVYISKDNGSSWILLFSKISNALVTATPQFSSTVGYVPDSSEWVQETVDVSAYAAEVSVLFKFEFLNDGENNIYLDDVRLDVSGAGVNEGNLDPYIRIFPNPSAGNVSVDFASPGHDQTDVLIYNMVGEEIEHTSHNVNSPKRVLYNLENQPNGVYFVKVKTKNGTSTKKLVLNR